MNAVTKKTISYFEGIGKSIILNTILISSTTFLFLALIYRSMGTVSMMQPHYVAPQPKPWGKVRDQPAGKESACQCRLARPTGCANPLRQQRKPDRTRWRVWHIGSSSYCTFARGMPCGAIPANQDAGNSHPEPFYGYMRLDYGCPCPTSFHKCGFSQLLLFSG